MNQFKEIVTAVANNEKTPLVLTIISCTGVIATAVLTARAAPKAHAVMEELRDAYPDKVPAREILRHTWKFYVPPLSVGFATLASIITMNRVSDRNVAILTAGATLATNTLKDYQQHVLEEIGAEKDSRIRDKIAKGTLAQSALPEGEMGFVYTDADIMCYDTLSGRYFKHNIEQIRKIENDLNRELLSEMSLSLNEVYDALGMEPIEVGAMLGFNTDNMLDFHFSAQLSPEKKPVLVLGYINMPVPNFNR